MKKCENCGRKNPFHTCFSGGSAFSMTIDAKTMDNLKREVERNMAAGKKDPYKGIPGMTDDIRNAMSMQERGRKR